MCDKCSSLLSVGNSVEWRDCVVRLETQVILQSEKISVCERPRRRGKWSSHWNTWNYKLTICDCIWKPATVFTEYGLKGKRSSHHDSNFIFWKGNLKLIQGRTGRIWFIRTIEIVLFLWGYPVEIVVLDFYLPPSPPVPSVVNLSLLCKYFCSFV